MALPRLPRIRTLNRISPTLFDALITCKAKAAWIAFGDRASVPQHPKALLGVCFHAVMENAYKGRLAAKNEEGSREIAREIFDRHAQSAYENAHPLVRAKFSSPQRLPFYNSFRERAAFEGADIAKPCHPASGESSSTSYAPKMARLSAERTLTSKDGSLIGRPDVLDARAAEVLDYKSGGATEKLGASMTPSEVRQLRLYAYLALDNGVDVSNGTIVRSGVRKTIKITKRDAEAEAHCARQALADFNEHAERSFSELAEPSVIGCRFCPCIAVCEQFWEAAKPDWANEVGIHAEARVSAVKKSVIQGIELVSLEVQVKRGTISQGQSFVEQVPKGWLAATGADNQKPDDIIRVVDGHLISNSSPTVIRVDRTATAVWRVSADCTEAVSQI
jgi:hypothetical protein